MANHFHNPMHEKPGGKAAPRNSTMKASMPKMRVKPGFNTGVPGKTQPKDRSGGTKRAKVYANSEGL